MTNRITNKNGVKLYTVAMVLAIAFAGVTLISSESTYAVGGDVATIVSGTEESTRMSFDTAVSNVTTGQTIKLYGDVEKDTLYTIADDVTIDGQENTITLTGSNQITKSISIINATLDGPAHGIGFTSSNSTYILKNVVMKKLTFFYDQAVTLQAEGCTFENGVQLQINGDGNKYSFADCKISELQISNTTRNTIITGTHSEAIENPVIIDQETQVNGLSGVSGGNIEIQDCTLNVDEINQYLWTSENGFYPNPNGKIMIGDSVHLVPINGDTVDFGEDIEIITPYFDSTDALGLKSYLENDFTISKKAFLADDLVIKEGVTLTIASTGSLDLNGYKLILEGNLIVANGGVVSAPFPGTESANTIKITKTGAITNSGIIGKDNGVVVTVDAGDDTGSGTALMDNVSGVELGLTKVIGDGVTYYLTVSGTVSKKTNIHSLRIDGAYISDLDIRDLTTATISDSFITKNGSLDIGSKSTVSIENLTLETGATLTIDGKITGTNATVSMKDGATAVINGNASAITFSAETGEYDTYDIQTGRKNVAEDKLMTSSTITVTGLNGLTIDVTSKVFTENRITKTEQMLNIYGVASFVKEGTTAESSGTIAVVSEVHTPAGKELTLAKEDMGFTFTDNAKILTEGTVKTATAISEFEGATYSVKNADGTFTYYYTTFDNAYARIADADMKKVTIKGGYTFAKEYTVAAEQTIEFTDDAEYKISKDGKVTVADEGTMSGKFVSTGTAGIQGILVVMNGASCTPASGSYEVKSVDTDGAVTYSGAAWAIENAVSGSTIDIVGAVTFEEKVTVPEEVTVNVKEGATISAEEGMAVNGKVLNGGEITIGKNLEVAGTVDNKDGEMNFGDGSEVTVTGLFLGNIAEGTKVNAAKYQGDVTIYTSVAKAVEASAAMDIPEPVEALGKVTEASDVTLGEGMVLTITGEVVLNSIRLEAGATLDVQGTLTSDVIGAVGKADTTGAISDAVIDLNKATKVESKLNYNESNSTSTLVLTIGTGFAGAVKVEKGVVSVDIPDTFELGTTASFTIGSEATVQLSKVDASITDATGKAFVNEGTLNVQKDMTISGTIGGTVIVKENITLTLKSEGDAKAVVVGDITLTQKDDKKAKLKVDGEVRVGTTPTTLGAAGSISGEVEFTTNSHAIVFEGSTFTSATEGLESTSYSVNGIALGTIYTTMAISINTMDNVVSNLNDLVTSTTEGTTTTPIDIVWMNGAEDVSDNAVGSVEAVNATLDYQSVLVKVSEGPGLQVYIDDVKTDGSEKLAIGTHTITVYLEPNYEGTPVIKFNGVAITDGTFEITTDMMGGDNKIVVTGATYVQPTTPVTPVQPIVTPDDDDMGLTEYLLIVLVILAAILVIVVAVRMMRS